MTEIDVNGSVLWPLLRKFAVYSFLLFHIFMTGYVLIEDERFACEEMNRMMRKLRPEYSCLGSAGSVEEAVVLLKRTRPDMMLVDVSLADGICFEIFDQVPEDIPVIFTTAYDEYAIKAFKVNSVDYLLKPVDEGDLEAALQKFERRSAVRNHSSGLERLRSDFISRNRKNRFLVQAGDSYRHIETKDIAYFYSEEKYTFLHLFSGGRYVIGYSLDQLEGMLDPGMFFRVSRGFITSIDAVVESTRYFGNRMVLRLEPEFPQRVLVSRGRVNAFFRWADGLYDETV